MNGVRERITPLSRLQPTARVGAGRRHAIDISAARKAGSVLVFLTIVVTILGLIHWFLYARLVGALDISSPAILWSLRLLAGYLALSYILARTWEHIAPEPVVHTLHWIASVWLGVMLQLLWMAAALLLVKVILVLTGLWSGFTPATVSMLGRYAALGALGAAVLLSGIAMHTARGPARIVQVSVPVKHITPELRDIKIAVASDFHAGVVVTHKEIERMVAQIMRLRPDLILLPGDILDRASDDILHFVDAFRNLQAPLGVYGSTGNHEYYIGINGALEFFEQAGVRMLINERVELPNGLLIAGIADRTAKQMRLPRPDVVAVLGDAARHKPAILMNHTPETAEALAATEAGADLIVSGHTHGGQIWPFSFFTRLAFRFHHGLYRAGAGHIFTSSGIGHWGPPMRLGAPPEIVLVRLVGPTDAAVMQWE